MRHVIRIGLTTLGLVGLTVIIIAYGRGYRFNREKKSVEPTGSIVATSDPNGANVYIDGKFVTATNSTIQVDPGRYSVRIAKEGYIQWEKDLTVRAEVVTKADATLFPISPSLSPLTSTGVENPVVSPDGSRVVFARTHDSTNSAQLPNRPPPEGLWVLDLSDRPLGLNRDPKKIAHSVSNLDWTEATLTWSPDGKQILALFEKPSKGKKTDNKKPQIHAAYLLESDKLNTSLSNVTTILDVIRREWLKLKQAKERQQLLAFPKEITKVASQSMNIIAFSPDETKIFYEATASATLALAIDPPFLGTDSVAEKRSIVQGELYVYDAKEDKNFFLMKAPSTTYNLSWLPDSRHIMLPENDHISIIEYDGTNKTTVYAGPFLNNFVTPWSSGRNLIILTTLNSIVTKRPNLYLVNLH